MSAEHAPPRRASGASRATGAAPGAVESLAGLIERVTYHQEDTGFSVVKVKVTGQRDLVTVVGSLAAVSAGEWLHAQGRWVRDREHGLQFKADLLTSTAPTTLAGIEKYLASGMVKGIGPVYAKKLVAQFGERIFDVIEHTSARLEEVEGIGPKRRHLIKAAWEEQKVVRQIMVFLHSHGVSTSRAVRIYKTYGNDAIAKLRANPYLLVRDIHGIGFKTADQIAQRLGLPAESLARARAGLDHVLGEAVGVGHCALPSAQACAAAQALLQVREQIVAEAFEQGRRDGDLVTETIEDVELTFLPRLRQAEIGIAHRLRTLGHGPPAYPAIEVEKALAWAQTKTGCALAPSQQAALRLALSHRALVITGGPGVGKTTLLKTLLLILRAKRVVCLLCAPTGRAAKRLSEATGREARTIHRLLAYAPGGGFTHGPGHPLACDLLVVDECSMVDVPLMHQLLSALPFHASLLLVGDVDQLPSVGPGLVLADIIASGRVPVARLTEVFRQAAHSQIVINAHRINEGKLPEPPPAGGESDFHCLEREDPARAVRTLLEVVSQRIPARFGLDPIRDVQVLAPMNRGRLGVHELNLALQQALNPPRPDEPAAEKFGWQFRSRDKVIQTENNYDKDVFNGDIGQIARIDPIEQEVRVRYEGREVTYAFGELDELALAYAITIHKSQGSEFPAVVIPLAMQHYVLLQRNLVYTAITRGKRLVVLIGQRRALALAVRHQKTEQRYSGLLARLRAEPA